MQSKEKKGSLKMDAFRLDDCNKNKIKKKEWIYGVLLIDRSFECDPFCNENVVIPHTIHLTS